MEKRAWYKYDKMRDNGINSDARKRRRKRNDIGDDEIDDNDEYGSGVAEN